MQLSDCEWFFFILWAKENNQEKHEMFEMKNVEESNRVEEWIKQKRSS